MTTDPPSFCFADWARMWSEPGNIQDRLGAREKSSIPRAVLDMQLEYNSWAARIEELAGEDLTIVLRDRPRVTQLDLAEGFLQGCVFPKWWE